MWNIRNSERDDKRSGETKWEKLERKTNHERLLTLGNKGLQKERWVRGWGNWMTGNKEGMGCDEPWVLHCVLAS